MGLELYILGVRKLKKEEAIELTGKKIAEMESSKYFREFFPNAPHDSWYVVHKTKSSDRKFARMYTPVTDVYGNTVYVFWEEILGYYWHKNPYDRSEIDRFMDNLDEPVDWDEGYHVVDPIEVSGFINRRPQISDTTQEIFAVLYG